MSGAGRSTAAQVLEDLGWFVIDNLPPGAAARPCSSSAAAAAADVAPDRRRRRRPRRRVLRRPRAPPLARCSRRGGRPADPVPRGQRRRRSSAGSRASGGRTRCRATGGILDGIDRERALLGDLRATADLVIDTSDLNVHELRARDRRGLRRRRSRVRLRATVMSLRVQVRPPGGRRPRRRRPVPAQPVLGARAARRSPAWTPAVARLRARRSRRPGSSSTATPTVAATWSPTGTCARASASSRSRSAARAASTAAWRWPRSSAARLRDAGRRASASCTATWGASERRPPGRPAGSAAVASSPSAAGTAWPPRCGPAPGHRPADRGRRRGRRRRLQRPAARRVRRACRPGDLRMALAALCGDDEWGRTWSRRGRSTGSAATASCDGHAVGNLLIIGAVGADSATPVAGLDWVGRAARRPRAGCCRCAREPLEIVGRGRWTPRGTRRAQRGPRAGRRWRRPAGAVVALHARAARPAGLPGGGRGDRRRPTGVVLGPGLLVHQRAAAPAGARAARRARRAPGAAVAGRAQPRRRSRGRPRASAAGRTSRSWPAHVPGAARSTSCSPTRGAVPDAAALAAVAARSSAPSWCCAPVAGARTAPRRHDPAAAGGGRSRDVASGRGRIRRMAMTAAVKDELAPAARSPSPAAARPRCRRCCGSPAGCTSSAAGSSSRPSSTPGPPPAGCARTSPRCSGTPATSSVRRARRAAQGNRYVVRVAKDGEALARQTGLLDGRGRPVRGLPPQVVTGRSATPRRPGAGPSWPTARSPSPAARRRSRSPAPARRRRWPWSAPPGGWASRPRPARSAASTGS